MTVFLDDSRMSQAVDCLPAGPVKRVPIKPLSGLFADALYAAMGTKLYCCLLAEQKLHPGCSYHQAICDLEGCRPLQLTLAACWVRMISVHLEGYRPDGFPPPHAHAYRKNTLNLAVTCLNKALLVSAFGHDVCMSMCLCSSVCVCVRSCVSVCVCICALWDCTQYIKIVFARTF